MHSGMVKNLQLENIETQSEDDHVYIGNFTQTYLTKVIDDGNISSQQCKWFINNTSIIQYNTQHNTIQSHHYTMKSFPMALKARQNTVFKH